MTSQGARRHGVLHGLGRLIKDGCVKIGLFRHGHFESGYKLDSTTIEFGDYNKFGNMIGEGFILSNCGKLIVGYFINGKLHGVGIVKKDQNVYCGQFENGNIVYGVWYSNITSDIYCGYFDDFQPHGNGTVYSNNKTHELYKHKLVHCSIPAILQQVLNSIKKGKKVETECICKARDYVQCYVNSYPYEYCPTKWSPVPICNKDLVSFLSDGSVYMTSNKEFGLEMFLFPLGNYYSHFIECGNKGTLYTVDGIRISTTRKQNGLDMKIKSIPDYYLTKLLQIEQIESIDKLINSQNDNIIIETYTYDEFELFVLNALYSNDNYKCKVGYSENLCLFVIVTEL